jgi:DNA-binding winged helix-turn-helix (wHTH) protein/tetratricopeptide (TPR) repeat protein
MKRRFSEVPGAREPGFWFGSLRLDPDGTLLRGATPIHLPTKELAALRYLLAHPGEIVSPAQLKDALWGDIHVTACSVPRCLSSLRARLEPEECLQTIYKRGYRFTAPVRTLPNAAPALLRVAISPFAAGPHVAPHLGTTIAEEITAALTATQPTLVAVLARDSVFTLAGSGATGQHLGEVLGADLVLTGTLTALTSHLRLRVEMIRIRDGVQIWVEDLLAAKERVPSLGSGMLQRLLFRLGGEPSVAAEATAPAPPHASGRPEAYELFLRGHDECQTLERHHMQDGLQHLLKATELDPSLLTAQVDLVHTCVTQSLLGFIAPSVAADHIRHIAAAIPDVAQDAPLILPPLGWVCFHVDLDLPSALHMFGQCAHLPHDSETTRLRVMLALSRHRFNEACELLRSALLLDPFAPWLHGRLAWALHLAGKPDQSMEQMEHSLELFPEHESTGVYGSVILAFNGDVKRAVRLAEDLAQRSPYFDIATAVHAYALACDGQVTSSRSMLERLQWLSRERFVLRSFTPAAHAALGDTENAISELRAAEDARCPWFFQMLADPRLKSLHGHPDFERMCTRLNDLEAAAEGPGEFADQPDLELHATIS